MYLYKNIMFEDVEVSDEHNNWSGICKKCVEKYGVPNTMLDEDGSGYCMVLGCMNRADYYIDFKDGDVRNIQGLWRDVTIALEHFGDYGKAKEYLINEFGNEYGNDKVVEILDKIQPARKRKCSECSQDCFDNSYPEVVFSNSHMVICEDCSIDYEERNGQIVKR